MGFHSSTPETVRLYGVNKKTMLLFYNAALKSIGIVLQYGLGT